MMKKFAVLFALVGLVVANAKTFTLNLHQPVVVGATELKAGEYKLEIRDQKAVISNGKVDTEVPVKIETAGSKFSSTAVRLAEEGGKMHLTEIRLGGTTTKLIVSQ
jgi:hypothetical protein